MSSIPSVVAYIASVAGMWKIFEKAHTEGWKTIIPYCNTYYLVKLVKRPLWFFWVIITSSLLGVGVAIFSFFNLNTFLDVMNAIPFVDYITRDVSYYASVYVIILLFMMSVLVVMLPAIILSFILRFDLAKVFGKSWVFAIGLIILPSIFNVILGFGSSTYLHSKENLSTM
jgi:hypothetical protein